MIASAQAFVRAPPRDVLIVITRRIGDVLLSVPLIESLHRAWPQSAIDVLAFENTQAILSAHPAVREIITIAERPTLVEHLALALRIARRYALALSLIPGDRPTLYAYLAGRRRVGMVTGRPQERWKRRLLHRWMPFDNLNTHTVRMHLALCDVLGIARSGSIGIHWTTDDASQVDALLGTRTAEPLAVLHPYPKYRYKMWAAERWGALGRWLSEQGYRIAVTGSRDRAELAYLDECGRAMPAGTVRAAGHLSLRGSACLVSRACLYIGPDTAMTHIAAALGVPTVALYGPSNPVKWGPWPKDHPLDRDPWRRCGTQRVRNVVLLQGAEPCVPCLLEGCDRHIESESDCLINLTLSSVQHAVDELLVPVSASIA